MDHFNEIRDLKGRVAAKRVSFRLEVMSKTIGSNTSYRLNTENVSKSGLLLSSNFEGQVPFQVNTILEMTIDPTGKIFNEPIKCLAKVVRLVFSADGQNRREKLGVQLLDLEQETKFSWETCLKSLEDALAGAKTPPQMLTSNAA